MFCQPLLCFVLFCFVFFPLHSLEGLLLMTLACSEKKRFIPDNSEDTPLDRNVPSKKKARIVNRGKDESNIGYDYALDSNVSLISLVLSASRRRLVMTGDLSFLPMQAGELEMRCNSLFKRYMIYRDCLTDVSISRAACRVVKEKIKQRLIYRLILESISWKTTRMKTVYWRIGVRTSFSSPWKSPGKFSICVEIHSIFFWYHLSYVNRNDRPDEVAEGSKRSNRDDDIADDPFVDVGSQNVMPVPPQPKKVYLEDYENFTVKLVYFECLMVFFMQISWYSSQKTPAERWILLSRRTGPSFTSTVFWTSPSTVRLLRSSVDIYVYIYILKEWSTRTPRLGLDI